MKASILPLALLAIFSIYSFQTSDYNNDPSKNLSSLVIGNNTIPVTISDKGDIEIQYLSTKEILVPVFGDTIITFDPDYYYNKLEFSRESGNTTQAVFSKDGLQIDKGSFLNTENPISLATKSNLPTIPAKLLVTVIKASGESFSTGYDLTHAFIKAEDKTAKKQEFIANELKLIFDNAQSGDKLLIWDIRFEHGKKKYNFKQNILIDIL